MHDVEAALRRLALREGGFVNHANDRGGATRYGVTAATLGRWRRLGRIATVAEVEALGHDEARSIFVAEYLEGPGLLQLVDGRVLDAALDASVLFGAARACGWLALVPDLVERVDAIGPDNPLAVQALLLALRETAPLARLSADDAAAVNRSDPGRVVAMLSAARIVRHAKRCKEDPSQLDFLGGWVVRSLAFTVTG